MSRAIVNSVLWWLAGLSATHVTQATNSDTDNRNSESEISSGQIICITLGSLGAVVVILAVTAGCLSCCSTKKTKSIKTNADGSNETTETEERGSQEVAGKIVGVAGSVASEIGEALAVVTHTTAITTFNARQNPSLSPNSARTNNVSITTATTVDSKAVLLAIKADIADGSSDGNKVATEGLRLLETQEALAQAAFLITESAKPQQAVTYDASIDIHPVDIQATGASSHLSTDH